MEVERGGKRLIKWMEIFIRGVGILIIIAVN
jgi:hypothetical protein